MFRPASPEDMLHIQVAIVLAYSMAITLRLGLFSLAPAALAGVGAYAFAILGLKADYPVLPSFLLAVIIATVVGAILAIPLARIKGIYTAIATLSVVVILAGLEGSLDFTGGFNGISGYPFGSPQQFLYVAIAIVVAGWIWLDSSAVGRRFDVAGSDPVLGSSVGVRISPARIIAFTVSAALAGIAGASYAYGFGYVSSTDFGFGLAIQIAAFTVVGGVRHWAGPLVGAGLLSVLGTHIVDVGNNGDVILGAVMVVAMVVFPGGAASGFRKLTRRRAGRSADAEPAQPLVERTESGVR